MPLLALAALALACALAPAVASAKVQPRIVAGQPAAITDFPFQVALFVPAAGEPVNSQYCGGVIIDQTHVITAAHCLFDVTRSNQVADPADIEVLAGTDTLSTGGQQFSVTQTSFDPNYDPTINDNDLGIITVPPLWADESPPALGGTTPPSIAPVPRLMDDAAFEANLTNGDPAIVTGWGDTEKAPPDDFPDQLQRATVPLVKTDTCKADYIADTPITANMFCAGDSPTPPISDSCQGDSGGPIVIGTDLMDPSTYTLAGLVDSGNGCADAGFPGIYDRISSTEFKNFLASNPPQAPEQLTPTTIAGGNQPGQVLTCTPAQWTDGDVTVQFLNTVGTALTPATADGTTYTIQPSDQGTSIVCQAEAKNNGGYGFARSSTARFVPVPAPVTPPVIPPPAKDTVAPKLHVSSKRCTKTSCTVKVRVTDSGSPKSGVAKVRATLNYSRKVRCKSRRARAKHRTCTKPAHRSLRAAAGAKGVFTIVARHLKPGTGYRIALVPFDKAGNRPQFSTITSIRTKPRHQRFPF